MILLISLRYLVLIQFQIVLVPGTFFDAGQESGDDPRNPVGANTFEDEQLKALYAELAKEEHVGNPVNDYAIDPKTGEYIMMNQGVVRVSKDKVEKVTGNADHPIRTYRNGDLSKLEKKYFADSKLIIEMPYVGKGKQGTNAEGWLRNKDFYWKEIMSKNFESISKINKQKIELGFSPINDKKLREYFPQYDIKELYNDTLIHHHVGGGGQAVAVPSKLHPGTGGIHNAEKAAGVWGNDNDSAILLEKFLKK